MKKQSKWFQAEALKADADFSTETVERECEVLTRLVEQHGQDGLASAVIRVTLAAEKLALAFNKAGETCGVKRKAGAR